MTTNDITITRESHPHCFRGIDEVCGDNGMDRPDDEVVVPGRLADMVAKAELGLKEVAEMPQVYINWDGFEEVLFEWFCVGEQTEKDAWLKGKSDNIKAADDFLNEWFNGFVED